LEAAIDREPCGRYTRNNNLGRETAAEQERLQPLLDRM